MKINFKHIAIRSKDLFVNTKKTWDVIAAEKPTSRAVRNTYVFPWICVCTLVVFLVNLLGTSERSFEFAFLKAFVAGLSLTIGYFVAGKACFWALTKRIGDKSQDACEIVVAYSFTTIFVLKILTSVFPSLFFLQILVVHCAYLLWEGIRAMLNLDEKEQENTILIFSLILIGSPTIINMLLNLMLPNA